jgi:hypothetical protein
MRKQLTILAIAIAFAVVITQTASYPTAVSSTVVISQVYGGGGNTGAPVRNDFIELFNRGTSAVSLNGWSVQYAATTGTSWPVTALTNVTLQPGQYYLVQESAGAGTQPLLPTPDASGGITMAAGAGKVALLSVATAIPSTTGCPSANVVDLVGYGTSTNCFEGTGPTTPSLTNTTAALRNNSGCAETDSNSADFTAGAPNPRNTAAPAFSCFGPTNPSATAVANPSPVPAGQQTTLTVTVTPGASPASTGLAVTANLSSIGGAASQVFTGVGNVFSFTATVSAGTSSGGKTLPVTITDAQSRTASTSISLSVTAATRSPTGIGTASPSSLRVDNSTLLTVSVSPGLNPTSTGLAVTGDLHLIGGSAAQQFFDDATHGDAVAGNNVFSFLAAVPAGTSTGAKSLPITITDAQARSTTTAITVTVKPPPPPTTIKISQVYGGGGNSGATYTNDFIELFNRGTTPVDITGWSVQYASSSTKDAVGPPAVPFGWSPNVTELCPAGPCFIDPGHYFLVREGAGAGGTTAQPAADATGTIAVGAGAGKIALVATTDPLIGGCPVDDNIVDFVGYAATANCAEAAPTANLSNTLAAVRRGNGCVDTDNNANDFVAVGPIPRNSVAPVNICGGNPSVPSGIGVAVPSSVEPAAETLLTVQVSPAVTPPSTAFTVIADLTSVGGSSTQQLFDDGTHGDVIAGDKVFSYLALMPATATTGAKNSVATILDAEGRTATAPITLTIVSPTCGVERWSVKVGTDRTVGLVNLTPYTPATIEALGLVTPPPEAQIADGGIFSAARSAPVETTVYTVDAMMTFYKKEADVDYHIVLDDGNGHTLISEIPSPACVITSGTPRLLVPSPLAEGIARARAKFDARLSANSFFQNASIPVRVSGVGFFDFEHGQTGVAPNAIELHPVLDISFRGNTATVLMSNENPSVFGDTVQLTATVTGGDGGIVPTGDVVFFDAGNSFTAALNASGQATYTTNALAAGTHTITAAYEGDDTSVPSTSAPFVEVVAKAGQTIDFAALVGKTYGDADFTVSGGASSGLPVTFAIASGPATISGGVVHITGAGEVTVRASQAGDDNYNPAQDLDRAFVVAQAGQTITFASLPDRTFGEPPFAVSASGGASGNPVTFTASGSCASGGANGATIALTGIGVCTVTASQAGTANYSAAADVPRAFAVFDRTAPVIGGVTPSVTALWPPNERMVPVSFAVNVSDDVDAAPACQVTGVASNEGSSVDWRITGPASVELRADRAGSGTGRTYVITLRCADASGNASTATATVIVPHDQRR